MTNWVDRTFPRPTFPLHLDLGFQMAQLFVVNATAANVYLSRGSQSNPTPGADATVPPYTPMPVYNWGSDTVFVGSDGAPLRTTDTLTVYATDDPAASFPAVGIGQPNYYDKPNPAYLGIGGVGSSLNQAYTIATYTVPVNRKAFIDALYLDIEIPVAATGGAFVYAFAQLQQPNSPVLTIGRAVTYLTAKGTFAQMAPYSQIGTIGAGAVLTLNGETDHTGGIPQVTAYAKLTEFDA